MATYNHTITICRNVELKSTNSGKLVANATAMWNQKTKADASGSTTCFIEIEAWGYTAEQLAKAERGTIINVKGDIIQRRWRDMENKLRSKFLINIQSFNIQGQANPEDATIEQPY